jgi:hypothetical protein
VRRLAERLPFETVTVSGHDAFATWECFRADGHGYPVVLGNEEEVADLFDTHAMEQHARIAAIAEVLDKAQELRHPADLQAKRRAEAAWAHEMKKSHVTNNPSFSDEARAWLLRKLEEDQPPLGKWPEEVKAPPGLSVIREIVSSEQDGQISYNFQIEERVVVALLPVAHSHEVLGYLLYGNWNACPPAEYHVAAQRSWSKRYGAEIVGINRDRLNIRVARKPETREEALKLACEHYIYCNDAVDQRAGTLSNLAAQLMQHEWWFFWWD